MKRFISFILALMIISGSLASAAPGDIIHRGTGNLYRKGLDEEKIVNDIVNGIKLEDFYKEIEALNGVQQFVNIVEREKAQEDYMMGIMKSNGFTSPDQLRDYMLDPKNKVKEALEDIAKADPVSFDEEELEKFFGSSKAPKLKAGSDYFLPIPGGEDYTLKITKLELPKEASSWIAKVLPEDLLDLNIDKVFEDYDEFKLNEDFSVKTEDDKVGKYLFLAAVDKDGRLKAYDNIEILDNMFNIPKLEVNQDDDIEVNFDKSDEYSGHTLLSGDLGAASWKLALVNELPGKIYTDSKFISSVDYINGMELLLANDEDLNKGLDDFKKFAIVYSLNGRLIERYNVFTLDQNNVSGLLRAKTLIEESVNPDNFNYTRPVKGNDPSTIQIKDLNLPEAASSWRYDIVTSDKAPIRHRVYEGNAKLLEESKDIKITSDKNLMILALDDANKVIAYAIVDIHGEMIKNEPPFPLQPSSHYRNLKKGDTSGKSNIILEGSPSLGNKFDSQPPNITWRYLISDKKLDLPESDSFILGTKVLTSGEDFLVASKEELKSDEDFNKHLLILATEGHDHNFKIKGYAQIPLTREYIRYPEADKLSEDNHYSKAEKGPNPGTTKISKLTPSGIDDHSSWWYKIVEGLGEENNPGPIEYKHLLNRSEGFIQYTPGSAINAKVGDYIVLVAADKNRRALAFDNIKLKLDQVTAPTANLLRPPTHYSKLEMGTEENTSRFANLYPETKPDSDNVKWMIKIGDRTFGQIESGIDGRKEGFKEYKAMDNIENLSPGKWLLLVRTDKDFNINGYVNIQLRQEHIRNNNAQEMTTSNYKTSKGDRAATTKIYDLNHGGIDAPNFNGWKWMYKLIDDKLTGEDIPYINQKLNGKDLAKDGNIDLGNKTSGYILLLATDSNGQTKAYAHIGINDDMISKPAAELNVSIKAGDSIDRVKFVGSEASYMYKMDTKEIPSPAKDEILYGAQEYKNPSSNVGIIAKAGNHLTIYKVDKDNKVQAFKSLVIKDVDIQKASVIVDETTILEGDVKIGGPSISFTLEGKDTWTDVKSDREIRNKLYDGLVAHNENTQWLQVVNTLKAGGPGNIFIEGKKVSIRLAATPGYDIREEQRISLRVPAEAVKDAVTPIVANGEIIIKPTIEASVSGSVVTDIVRQKDIEKGGATIEIKLKDAYWALDVKDVLSKSYVGIKGSDQTNTNWSKIKAAVTKTPNSIIVRDANTIRITLPPVAGLNYASNKETITLNIDGKFIQGSEQGDEIVAGPTFTIYPDILKIETELVDSENRVIMEAPDNKTPLKDNDIWNVKLTNATLKDEIKNTDVDIIGMPAGLKYILTRKSDTELSIKMTASASKGVNNNNVRLVVKGSAVNELNSMNSDALPLPYIVGTTLDLKEIQYEIVKDEAKKGIYLSLPKGIASSQIQYSINSTSGVNGEWHDLVDEGKVSDLIGPVTIFVREKDQIKSFHKIVDLNHPKPPLVSVENYKYILDYKLNLLDITLKSEEKNLEYSKDNGANWTTVTPNPDSKLIEITGLDKSSVLLFRTPEKAGLNGVLPSLATAKLNGLFLGDVKLDVSQRKILGATRDMKYKLSADGSWSNISSNDPVVDFKEGNEVWISEAKDEKNQHRLGPVSQTKISPEEENQITTLLAEEVGDKGIYYDIRKKEIVNKTKIIEGEIEDTIKLQYNISKGAVPTGTWYDLKDTASNVNFIPGNVFVRKIDDGSSLPSNPIKIFEVAEGINPPKIEVNQDDKTLLYESSGGTYKILNADFEYRIDNGDYQDGDLLEKDPKRFGNVKVYVKRKATKTLLQSKEVSFTFTESISLANVRVNVAEGLIEGTTSKMEYRSDENSPWKVAGNGNTEINMYEGMNVWIREVGTTRPVKELLIGLKVMPKPIPSNLEYDVSQKIIKNTCNMILEYRINNDPWKTINVGQTISIEFVPTKLSIRTKATVDILASDVVNVVDSLDYPDQAPIVEIDDDKNEVKSIDSFPKGWAIYEFKLKTHSEWMPGTMLRDYDLSGDKIVQVRKKASPNKLASEIAEVIFTKNLNLANVKFRATTTLKLLGTEEEMEYKVYIKDMPLPTTWIKASSGTTNLDSSIKIKDISIIVVRDSRNVELTKVFKSTFKNNIEEIVHGEASDLPLDLNKISYEIEEDGITFRGVSFSNDDKFGLDHNRLLYKHSLIPDNEFKENLKLPLEVTEIFISDKEFTFNTRSITISERADKPKARVNSIAYLGEKIKLSLDGFDSLTMEYLIKEGDNWSLYENNTPTVEIPKNASLGLRTKATVGGEGVGKLPSEVIILNTTSLMDVGINMGLPTLTNTSVLMEYSLNATNWNKIKDPDKLVISELKLGSNIWIREIANPGNIRKIGPIGQEEIPVLPIDKVYFNISNGRISNFTKQDLEYRVANGDWKPINESLEGKTQLYAFDVEFAAGNLEFRKAAKGSNIASKPVIFKVIRVPLLGPNVSKGFDPVKYENIINGNLDNLEYSFGANGPWKDMDQLDNKTLLGDIYIRSKAGEHTLPSLNTKLNFQPLPPLVNLKMVSYNDHLKPLQLNGTNPDMEYMINGSKVWFACDETSTKLKSMISTEENPVYLSDPKLINKIEIRYKDKTENIVILHEGQK